VGLSIFDFVGFFSTYIRTFITSFLIVIVEVVEGNVEMASVQPASMISD
jgi:hypothetical protein